MTGFTQVATPRGGFGVRQHGAGRGDLVVCLHGFPDDASTFDDLAAALVIGGYRVAAVNLRGYAPSPLDGSLALQDLVADLHAVVDALSPAAAVHLVGHDYGAQLAYAALAGAPHRFRGAVLISGGHPAFVQRNARRSPRQLWLSRYIVFFQLGAFAERRVARDDFRYVERLWRRWSPGFEMPRAHREHVKSTLRASMPGPVAMYRAGDFTNPTDPIAVPTLYLTGGTDGCALPGLADGQQAVFTRGYRAELWDDVGHYPHLEQPDRLARRVREWFARDAPST